MTDELAPLVAASGGPGSVDDLLREAMDRLRSEYPGAQVHQVMISFSVMDIDGRPDSRGIDWRVRAGTESGYGSCSSEAFAELRQKSERVAVVLPEAAARVAALMRDMPAVKGCMSDVIALAHELLADERLGRR